MDVTSSRIISLQAQTFKTVENSQRFLHITTRARYQKKKKVDTTTSKLKFKGDGKGKEYKAEAIWDNAIYVKKSKTRSHL